jgi:hydrogenase nickel incorporation protein HypA/HybF
MHELSLAQSVLHIVEAVARRDGFARVTAVQLEIGALAPVDSGAMRFCFDAVMRDTIAQGARLEIIAIPGSAWCTGCARSVPVAARYDSCPDCGSYPLRIDGGTEMRVKELEVG